jgi:hypothetical protein
MLLNDGAPGVFSTSFLSWSVPTGGVYEYIRDTLDPLPSSYLLKTGAYFYLLVSNLFTQLLLLIYIFCRLFLATILQNHVLPISLAPGLKSWRPIPPKQLTPFNCTLIQFSSVFNN